MKIEKLMSSNVAACHPAEPLSAAAKLMWDRDIGFLPVVDDKRVTGVITDRDLAMAAYLNGCALDQIAVSRVMSRKVVSCRPDTEVAEAEELMKAARIRRLPVISASGKLEGVVSLNDIARASQSPKGPDAVRADEVAGVLAAVSSPRRHDGPDTGTQARA